MKNNSSPEISKKKVKAGHKKQSNSRKTLNDINEFFRIIPDENNIFTPEITKNEQKQTDPKNTTKDQRKHDLINFKKNIDDNMPIPKMIKKNEKNNLNNSKTLHKKRDVNECILTTIIPDKKNKDTDRIPKAIKEDTRKNLNFKHACEEVVDKVVDKENLRKNNRYFRDENKTIKEDTKRKPNYKHIPEEVYDKENIRKSFRHFREEDKAIKEDTRKNPNYKRAHEEVIDKVFDKENIRKSFRYFRDEDKAIKEDTRKNPYYKHVRNEVVDKVVNKENLSKTNRNFRDEDKAIKDNMRKNLNSKHARDEVVVKVVVNKENLSKTSRNFRDEDKAIKDNIRKNQNYKHARDDVVDKVVDKDNLRRNNKNLREDYIHRNDDIQNLRKNHRYFREEDIHRNDVRKKFNSIVRDEAKGDIKHNSKLVADLKINISKPMGDVLKTNNKKFNRDEKDTENRGGGDIGKQIKAIKPIENKKIDDKRIYSNIKEVPVAKPFLDIISKKKQINDRYTIRLKNVPLKENTNLKENTTLQENATLKENTALKENSTLKENTTLEENTTLKENAPLKETTGKSEKGINSDVEKTTEETTPILKSCEPSEKSVHTESKSVGTKLVKKPIKADSNGQRKPIIKTVRVKNDNRVFKSVTFVDRKQPTPLLISIPTHYRKPPKKDREPKHTVKHNTSKDSFVKKLKLEREKSAKIKKRSKRRRILSPDLFTKEPSPPTEVAKWDPSCINHHTKPYYEAWVDTTLAATNKCLQDDEFSYHRQQFVKAFKTALEKPLSEEIVFDKIGDERYTGKIRVRHR